MKFKITTLLLSILIMISMAVIFYNSSQNGKISNKLSNQIIQEINKKTLKSTQGKNITQIKRMQKRRMEELNLIIRKFAHFFQFMVLAIFLLLLLQSLIREPKKAIIITLIIVAIYASLDELHQLFVDGRTAQIGDVFIDVFGGAFGVIIVEIANKILKVFSKKRKKSYVKKAVNN